METHNGVVIDRRGDGRTDYPLPGGGVMPQPRLVNQCGLNADQGTASEDATQNTSRNPTHPAPIG